MKFATGVIALLLKRHFPGRIGATPDMERGTDSNGWNGMDEWTAIYGPCGRKEGTRSPQQLLSNARVNHEKKTAVASPSFISSFLSFPNLALVCSAASIDSVGCYDTRVSESDTRRVVVRLETSFFLPLQRDPKPTRRLVFHLPACENSTAPKMVHWSGHYRSLDRRNRRQLMKR